jgi:hypothetical protein
MQAEPWLPMNAGPLDKFGDGRLLLGIPPKVIAASEGNAVTIPGRSRSAVGAKRRWCSDCGRSDRIRQEQIRSAAEEECLSVQRPWSANSAPAPKINIRIADNAPEATLRHLPKMHCTGNAGE